MTATLTTRPRMTRIDTSNVDPIVEVWLNQLPSTGVIGWFTRREYGADQIPNPVHEGDSCSLYQRALLACDEFGAWF